MSTTSICPDGVITITIFRITASKDTSTSDTTEAAQRAALEWINSDPTILPCYKLKLKVERASGDSELALEDAIEVGQQYSQCQTYNESFVSPIVMGMYIVQSFSN